MKCPHCELAADGECYPCEVKRLKAENERMRSSLPCGWCVSGTDCPRHPRTGNEEDLIADLKRALRASEYQHKMTRDGYLRLTKENAKLGQTIGKLRKKLRQETSKRVPGIPGPEAAADGSEKSVQEGQAHPAFAVERDESAGETIVTAGETAPISPGVLVLDELTSEAQRLGMYNSAYTLDDYWQAPSGVGPLADEWKDKPHRLLYDLIGRLRSDNPKHAVETCVCCTNVREVMDRAGMNMGGINVPAFMLVDRLCKHFASSSETAPPNAAHRVEDRKDAYASGYHDAVEACVEAMLVGAQSGDSAMKIAAAMRAMSRESPPRCHRTLGCTQDRDHDGGCTPSTASIDEPKLCDACSKDLNTETKAAAENAASFDHRSVGAGGGDDEGYTHPDVVARSEELGRMADNASKASPWRVGDTIVRENGDGTRDVVVVHEYHVMAAVDLVADGWRRRAEHDARHTGTWLVVRTTSARYLGAYEWVRNPPKAAHFITREAAEAAAEVARESNSGVTVEAYGLDRLLERVRRETIEACASWLEEATVVDSRDPRNLITPERAADIARGMRDALRTSQAGEKP